LDGLRVMHSTIDDFITYMDIGTVKKAARPLTPEAVKGIDFFRQAVTRLDKPF
ncbi:LysR family transcriptional regulator, partial [Citrobacter freundii]|nr:LysR family transcriptional regulator [Citrobacter freundii]